MTRLIDELNKLHDAYATAINHVVEDGHTDEAYELAAAYDRDAILLTAKYEGREDLLPLFGMEPDGTALRVEADTPLRRMIGRLTARRAA